MRELERQQKEVYNTTVLRKKKQAVLINHKCCQYIRRIVWNIEGVLVFPHFFFIKSRHGDWWYINLKTVSIPTSFLF